MQGTDTSTDTGRWNRSDLDYLALVDQWHVVAKSSAVTADKPLGCTLLGERLVVWRAGEMPMAWADSCPHRGAPLSLGRIKGCNLVCPYHGWEYDTAGDRVNVPAHPDLARPMPAPIRQFKIAERYGFVWVCLGNPSREIPRIPQWQDDAYRKSFAGPYLFRANALHRQLHRCFPLPPRALWNQRQTRRAGYDD